MLFKVHKVSPPAQRVHWPAPGKGHQTVTRLSTASSAYWTLYRCLPSEFKRPPESVKAALVTDDMIFVQAMTASSTLSPTDQAYHKFYVKICWRWKKNLLFWFPPHVWRSYFKFCDAWHWERMVLSERKLTETNPMSASGMSWTVSTDVAWQTQTDLVLKDDWSWC